MCTAVGVPNAVVCAVLPRTIGGCKRHQQLWEGKWEDSLPPQSQCYNTTLKGHLLGHLSGALERNDHQVAHSTLHWKMESYTSGLKEACISDSNRAQGTDLHPAGPTGATATKICFCACS